MAEILKDTTNNTIGTGDGGLQLDPSGTEVVTINNGVMIPDGTKSEPAIRLSDDTNTGIYSPTDDSISFVGNGSDVLQAVGAPSGVNYAKVTSSAIGADVALTVDGTDTNVNLSVTGKGTGGVKINNLKYPTTDGSSNNVIKTNGAGELSFSQIDYTEIANTPTQVSAIDDLSDVTVTAPSNGEAIVWNGAAWVNQAVAGSSPLTTKGDLYTYTTTDARLPVGTFGQVLTVDASEAAGVKWATPTTGGTVGTVSSIDFGTITGSGNANIDAGSFV